MRGPESSGNGNMEESQICWYLLQQWRVFDLVWSFPVPPIPITLRHSFLILLLTLLFHTQNQIMTLSHIRMIDNLDSELVKAKDAYIRRLTVRAVGIWEHAGKPKQLQFSMLINDWRMNTVWSFPNACFPCLVFFSAPSSSFSFADAL
jgi:hypothetical protein